MTDKMSKDNKYAERHRFWTDKAFSQLSMSIEVMFALTVATLGYILDNDNHYSFCWCSQDCSFSFKMFALLVSILTTVASVFYGLLSMISRNLDLRLTRHITYLRKSEQTKIEKETTLQTQCFGYCKLLSIFFCGYRTIEPGEYSNSDFMTRFNELRWTTKCLGNLTWSSSKLQIAFLFCGILFYVVYRLANV